MRLFRHEGQKVMRSKGKIRGTRIALISAAAILSCSQAIATQQLANNLQKLSSDYTVMQSTDGNFYVTSGTGGANGFGFIYKITTTQRPNTTTILASYTEKNECEGNYSRLVLGPDGNLWGASACTGPAQTNGNVDGEIYKVSPTTGALASVVQFNGSNGSAPSSRLIVGTDGFLYGTTSTGGANGQGTVFKLGTDGTLVTLHSFSAPDGYNPAAPPFPSFRRKFLWNNGCWRNFERGRCISNLTVRTVHVIG